MSSQPGTCHRIEVPRHILTFQRSGKAENIAGDRCRPSSCSEISLRSLLPRFHQCTDKVNQRKHALIQVGRTSRPIIHLDIDVIMIIHTPRSIDIIVPNPLQISRHIARTGTGNQKITSKLIIQLFQIIIRLSFPIIFQTLGSR